MSNDKKEPPTESGNKNEGTFDKLCKLQKLIQNESTIKQMCKI